MIAVEMVAMTTDAIFVDTNVLVYALFADSPHHKPCLDFLRSMEHGSVQACIAPQTIAELYATITNPRRVSNPYPAGEAINLIEKLLAAPGLVLLPVPVDLPRRMLDLLRSRPVTGAKIFDVQIAATMLGNGVGTILTFNDRDFSGFETIEIVVPGSATSV